MIKQQTIREQLAPLVRQIGVNEVARRMADSDAPINRLTLMRWLAGKPIHDGGNPATMSDRQLSALSEILGVSIVILNTTH